MPDFRTIELKPFVPAKDFEVSKRFYKDVGFSLAWDNDDLAYFHHENVSFLLQKFYVKDFAENLMLHLLVEDADAWRARLDEAKVAERYDVRVSPVEPRPWGMRDFTLFDPSGVLWRIAENSN